MLSWKYALTLWLGLAGAVGEVGAQAPALTPDQLAEELVIFRRDVFEIDRAFSPSQRREATARLDALEQRLAHVDPLRFSLELSRVLALADNGHTLTFSGPRTQRTLRVPIRLLPFADANGGVRFVVVRARSDQADLLGAELLGVGARGLVSLRRQAHQLVGGPTGWRDRWTPAVLESPEQLHALGLVAKRDVAHYRFKQSDGRLLTRELRGEPAGTERAEADSERWLLPDPVPGEKGWRTLLSVERAPRWLQEASQFFRLHCDTETRLYVAEVRVTGDRGEQKIAEFAERAKKALEACAPEHAVLDLRLNTGGDLNKLRDFAQLLPRKVTGKLYVLTSPWTFSAAISTTAYLKQAGGERVRIVGEEVGDRLEFFAEGRVVRLPHSGDFMLPATERHDYRDGCRRYRDCHGSVVEHPIRVPSLAPDLRVPLTPALYAAGRDPVMEAVLRHIADRRR